MTVAEVIKQVNGRIVCGDQDGGQTVGSGFASDLMSDVLTLSSTNPLLITGLANVQAIRTAEMADISVILFVRGKSVTPEMKEIAEINGMTLIETDYSMFRTSGLLYSAGLQPVY